MEGLLKFITCGSVDDGKSTLIGHILYDAKLLFTDQKKALELDSKLGSREGAIDYSLLLDGLMAEREQGITIDVAYRYFTTDHRSFIVADTPGHEEYTRNMAVGASFADLAIILVDAAQGVLVQTKRHARICSLMGIRHFVFAVNKMDLIAYDLLRFQKIEQQIQELVAELALENIKIIPVSATEGDNITKRSDNIKWYKDEALLTYLENVDVESTREETGFYMPVQRVCRPNHNFRGFQGQIEAGKLTVGDEITTLPSNERSHVKSIHVADKETTNVYKGQPVTIQLDTEVDVSKGCVLEKGAHLITTNHLLATILWMDDSKLTAGKNFIIKIGTKMIPGIVQEIKYKIDVNSGEHQSDTQLVKNEIALCNILLSEKIVVDEFNHHKTLGELILIDRISNMTSACGVVESIDANNYKENSPKMEVTRELRARQKGQEPVTLYFTDSADCAGIKIVKEIEKRLIVAGKHTMFLEKLEYQDIGNYAKLLSDAGIIVLIAGESLAEEEKSTIEELIGSDFFVTVDIENKDQVDIDKLMDVVYGNIRQNIHQSEWDYQI